MLYDIERCTACRACMVACKQWHGLPAEKEAFDGEFQSHKDLTANTYTLIKMNERVDDQGKLINWDFCKVQCMHCGDAGCLNGCPTGAISRKASGAVVIDHDICVGCGYCTVNCPFGIPKINEETHKSHKCDLCFDRIEEGMIPSCAQTCTGQCLKWGTLEEITEMANARLEELKAKYPNANIYGTNLPGVKNTHKIYVLPEKPSTYGFPENPTVNSATNLWRDVIKPVGKVVAAGSLVGAAGMLLLHTINKSTEDEGGTHHAD